MSIDKQNALARAKELLAKMTFEEKIMQMLQLASTDNTSNLAKLGLGSVINAYDETAMQLQKEAVENSRLGIPILFSIDCIHGHALNPAIIDLKTFILYAVAPFNLLKGIVISVLTVLLYNRIGKYLEK